MSDIKNKITMVYKQIEPHVPNVRNTDENPMVDCSEKRLLPLKTDIEYLMRWCPTHYTGLVIMNYDIH